MYSCTQARDNGRVLNMQTDRVGCNSEASRTDIEQSGCKDE